MLELFRGSGEEDSQKTPISTYASYAIIGVGQKGLMVELDAEKFQRKQCQAKGMLSVIQANVTTNQLGLARRV